MYRDEVPSREVFVEHSFFVGKYPVSCAEFLPFLVDKFPASRMRAFFEVASSQFQRLPAVMVSLHEASAYCEWLSNVTGDHYRLLTEVEWEFMCRAGTTTEYWWGDDFDTTRANNRYEYLRDGMPTIPKTYEQALQELQFLTAVDNYPPNPWEVADLHGNTWEWVQDIYDDARVRLAMAPRAGSEPYRSNRGGSWMDPPASLRSAVRSWAYPTAKDRNIGLRIGRDY
jgi:formylglycine-generating enzyme required for sulfatase activity